MVKHSKLFLRIKAQQAPISTARLQAQEKQRLAGNAPENTRLAPEPEKIEYGVNRYASSIKLS